MKTYDYYGWTVSDEDVLYHKLIEKNINIVDADKDKVKQIINDHVTNQTVALDIGCHYGFMTEFLAKHFKSVHAFDFDNDIFACFFIVSPLSTIWHYIWMLGPISSCVSR